MEEILFVVYFDKLDQCQLSKSNLVYSLSIKKIKQINLLIQLVISLNKFKKQQQQRIRTPYYSNNINKAPPSPSNPSLSKMQPQLPSPQQIYDMSTDQLSKLRTHLQSNIHKQHASLNKTPTINQELQSLKELLENISLQIEERKTIEFFTELCISDGTANKYVKDITDFNNQFRKLANQLINNSSREGGEEGESVYNRKDVRAKEQGSKKNDNKHHTSTSSNKDPQYHHLDRQPSQRSVTSEEFHQESHTISSQTTDFTTSATSDLTKKAGQTITKKMGLGHPTNMKKNKNAMQQFIRATLGKSKAVDYVSTKGGSIIKKSPDGGITNNGSHISHQESTPLSTTKSIKPASQGSETGARKQAAQSTGKNAPPSTSQKSIPHQNRQTLIKKRNQAIEKMKNMKKPQTHHSSVNNNQQGLPPQVPKKKGTKGMDAKSLVQMVKQEEDAKKRREEGQVEEKPVKKQKQETKSEGKKGQVEIKQHQSKEQQKPQKQYTSTSELSRTIPTTNNQQTSTPNSANQQTTHHRQPQFPIKQEINPVSSSDTESDTDSVKLSRKKEKKTSIRENLMKNQEQLFCSIPEEEIEESIAAVKDQQQLKKVDSRTIVENKVKRDTQASKKDSAEQNVKPQSSSNKNSKQEVKEATKSKERENYPQLKSTKKINSEEFGKITEEEYNPNGYQQEQERSDDEQRPSDHLMNDNSSSSEQNQQQQTNNYLTTQPLDSSQPSQPTPSTNQSKPSKPNQKPTKQQKKSIIDQQNITTPSFTDLQTTNKMYNEEYWLHIKEEAQAKIQRFKQEKEIERKEREMKAKLIEEESRRIKGELEGRGKVKEDAKTKQGRQIVERDDSSTLVTESNGDRPQVPVALQDDDHDKFIQQQKSNLKKIYSQNNTNGSSKKSSKKPSTVTIIKHPKPCYPLPQFNYLQIYPTFNHIFNVFYTKPQSQALLDIPVIMKQLCQMFHSHLEYQKTRQNNFRPAIFLPFDSRNTKMNQFSDARMLLQHAETTWVNLKTLVERVEVFNANIQGEFENSNEEERMNTQFYRVVKTKEEVYDIITTTFLRRKGWKELPHGQNLKANWNLFWSWAKPELDMNKLLTFQRINHFPFNKNLSRKDLLYKNIDSFRKTHKVPFPFLPLTFNLPKEFTQFSKRFHEQQLINRQKNYWIMKPIGKSRGRGIKLINSLGDLNYLDNIVVQKYIANPLLIEGYKFDMRIYVLVTSFHPLEAFVYREGFARLSTEKYSLDLTDMKNNFVHLTNFAINRQNQQANQQFSQGSKISLKSLKEKVTKMGYSFASVWSQVHQIIIKSLLACSVTVPPFPAAFQLFGYDIMIDDSGQCSLIEVNSSPSLQRSYMIDEIIKQSLIDDIIEIVNPPVFSKEEVINVMNERMSPDFRATKKGQKGGNVEEEDLVHLARILKYKRMRKYGEMPEKIGLFEMVAPSPVSVELEKLIKSKSGVNKPHNID